MKAKSLYQELKKNGFGPFVGVPCSILKPFLKLLDKKKETIIATNEGEAVGIASGLYLTGKKPVVFMQNSGLGNIFDPLTSLNLIYKIPLLLLITLRGEPGCGDAIQHKIMGQKTKDFLDILDIEYKYLAAKAESLKTDLVYLRKKMEKQLRPVAFLLRQGVLEEEVSPEDGIDSAGYNLNRQIVIKEIAAALNNKCLVVTTSGKITREHYFSNPKPDNNFYMLGSMGCASAIGLGVAMAVKADKRVVVLDGDGAVLMKMGNLATIGNVSAKNLIHIVLDNQCHESTGGQKTASSTVALDKVARACGYLNIYRLSKVNQIKKTIEGVLSVDGPSFILIKISKTGKKDDRLGRPKESPEQIKEQFMKMIRGTKC